MDNQGTGRRGFLKGLTGLLTLGIGAVIGSPAVAYLLAPIYGDKQGKAAPVPIGKLSALAVGVPRRVEVIADRRDAWTREENVRLGSVWLVRKDGGQVDCFSTVCPHLGCAIDYDQARKRFACPCHDSVFSLDGKVVSGPSPRSMDSLELVTRGEELLVHHQRFRQGTSRKEPT